MPIYKGLVTSVYDETDGERIRVAISPFDNNRTENEIPFAFPLLPKQFRVKPQVGEGVFVLVENENKPTSQRFYIGPIISQPQDLQYESYIDSGKLMYGSIESPQEAPSVNPQTRGCYALSDEDVAIYSRGDSDIILGIDDLNIRCGCRKNNTYNKKTPSYIKLKQHTKALNNGSNSSVSVVGEDINILSTVGDGADSDYVLTSNDREINDVEMNKIIEKAHLLPYGDVLVDFLQTFLQMFKSHTHKYSNMPPCPDDNSKKMDMKYGTGTGEYSSEDYVNNSWQKSKQYENVSKTFSGLGKKLLSKHVRIN